MEMLFVQLLSLILFSDLTTKTEQALCPEMQLENGKTAYLGERRIGTYAYIDTCADGYSMDSSEGVECLPRWSKTLHCIKIYECRTLANGKVTDNGKSFECNEGYVNADNLLYERHSCSCDRNISALVCNGRQAKCEPIVCKINSAVGEGMTVIINSAVGEGMTVITKGLFVTTSAIEVINHGESALFDCQGGENCEIYEPKYRVFKCDSGNWIADNRGGVSWSLGNNGTFPACRPAKCNCQHGGTCIRDETCDCTPFSTGAQCETPICHGGCQNGGNCTSPNTCSCPKRFSGNRCEIVSCQLNSPIEQGMTLKYKGTFITASTIESIDHGMSVTFNCEIGDNAVTYEPKNRIFRCDQGNWIEDKRRGDSWSLGNDGTFPKCRPAKCSCQHGGICIRDETCDCTPYSTGPQCETPVCHGGCQNDGNCTSPNECSCPKRFSGNRCETEGCGAPVETVDDRNYQIGATYTVTQESCSHGNIPSFKGQITCDNGHWSEQVTCLTGTRYRIRVKTADIRWRYGEGTDGEVYLYMFGSKGNSGKIILNGKFEAGSTDFTDGLFVDVGKISQIRLGVKAKSLTNDGWTPESLLIEDVSRRAYYKFVHDLTEIDDTSIVLYPVARL